MCIKLAVEELLLLLPSLFDALMPPKKEETLMPDDDDESALIEDDGYRGLGTSLLPPPGLLLHSDRLLLFRLYCCIWDDSEEVRIILSERRGISGAI